jgi:hypothetical protein
MLARFEHFFPEAAQSLKNERILLNLIPLE